MVDMFFYREPEEVEEQEANQAGNQYNQDNQGFAAPAAIAAPMGMGEDWNDGAAQAPMAGGFDPAMAPAAAAYDPTMGGFDAAQAPMDPAAYTMPQQQMDPTGFGAQY